MKNIFEYYDEDVYLAHHGIKGQKWGIRRFQNPDGTLTEAGKERYKKVNNSIATQNKIHKIISETPYNKDFSDQAFTMLHADKKYLNEAKAILQKNTDVQKEITKEVDKLFADLRSDENMHVYEAASELAAYAQYSRHTTGFFNEDVDEFTIDDLGQAGFMGVLEDGQQSDINAYSMYTSKHGLEKQINNLVTRSDESNKNARKDAIDIVSKGLSEVGADTLTASPKNKRFSLQDSLVMHLMNSDKFDSWEDTSGSWYANQASECSTITKQDKQNIDKAERYVRKLNKASDANTWWYVNEAAQNLGISSTKLKDMSQSDWDRINAEIQKLRNK